MGRTGGAGGPVELDGVAAAVVAVEPDRRRTLADELEVDVDRPTEDVAEEPPVAVDLVEPRIRLDANGRPGRKEASEEGTGLCAVALALLNLRRVDLDEPNVRAVGEHDRVSVDHVLDPRELRPCGRGRSGESEREPEENESAPHTASVGSAARK